MYNLYLTFYFFTISQTKINLFKVVPIGQQVIKVSSSFHLFLFKIFVSPGFITFFSLIL